MSRGSRGLSVLRCWEWLREMDLIGEMWRNSRGDVWSFLAISCCFGAKMATFQCPIYLQISDLLANDRLIDGVLGKAGWASY